MKVIIDIDDQYDEPSITIHTNEWTDELEEIVSIARKQQSERLLGIDEEQTVILNPKSIDYVYAENRKVFAKVKERSLEVKMKLYEIEQALEPNHFMRFSKSVVGNLNNIERFELSFNGNLCVYFHSGNKEYITRTYVSSIKDRLTNRRGNK